jgi:molecular chaperone HtpG
MAKRTKKFKTEVQQLLDLVVHSLYSKKEIFLRELISNASDAIDRLRFEALTDSELIADGDDWKIKITADKERGLLTISDNGIGMTAEEVEQNIGTIAKSGSRQFLEQLKETEQGADVDFIGQFGVGFYASFMVADKVTVLTRRAGEAGGGVRWASSGTGNYTIEEGDKAERGTDVILHLKEDMAKFADDWQVRSTVREYSDYISYPIVMDVAGKADGDDASEDTVEEETLNSMKAIWRKDRKSVKKAEYNEFYTHITHDHSEPLKVIHYAVEGATEFHALLYIPAQAPFVMFTPDTRHGLHKECLYQRRLQGTRARVLEVCSRRRGFKRPSLKRFSRGAAGRCRHSTDSKKRCGQASGHAQDHEQEETGRLPGLLPAVRPRVEGRHTCRFRKSR